MITDGPTAYITGPGGLPIEQITQNGTVRYFHHDQLGSTTALTNQSGSTVASYDYDAYGNPVGVPPAVENPFGFAGQYTDAATGLQYLRARYYDPATGQFLTRDPLETDTRQPYAYAGNSPTNYVDPTGEDFLGIGSFSSNAAAGALDTASFGYSTKLAGKVFGFDAECAEFGHGFGYGQIAGLVAGSVGGIVVRGGERLAARAVPKALGPGTSIGAKTEAQLASRGWTERLVQSTIDKPTRTVSTRDTRHLPDGGRMNDPATAYYGRRGGYVVRNDRTGDVVQVSNRRNPGWKAPW